MGKKNNRIQKVQNRVMSSQTDYGFDATKDTRQSGGSNKLVRNLSNYIAPVQLQRLRHDVAMWREAVTEAENAWYPHRVRMQRMYVDTILNGHVFSLMERRKDLMLIS